MNLWRDVATSEGFEGGYSCAATSERSAGKTRNEITRDAKFEDELVSAALRILSST
jgi:hypothetical protein